MALFRCGAGDDVKSLNTIYRVSSGDMMMNLSKDDYDKFSEMTYHATTGTAMSATYHFTNTVGDWQNGTAFTDNTPVALNFGTNQYCVIRIYTPDNVTFNFGLS